jgi:hypothetical protein
MSGDERTPRTRDLVMHGRVDVPGGATNKQVADFRICSDRRGLEWEESGPIQPLARWLIFARLKNAWIQWRHEMQRDAAVRRMHIWESRDILFQLGNDATRTTGSRRTSTSSGEMNHIMFSMGFHSPNSRCTVGANMQSVGHRSLPVITEVEQSPEALSTEDCSVIQCHPLSQVTPDTCKDPPHHEPASRYPQPLPTIEWWRDCGTTYRSADDHEMLCTWIRDSENRYQQAEMYGSRRYPGDQCHQVLAGTEDDIDSLWVHLRATAEDIDQTRLDYSTFLTREWRSVRSRTSMAAFWQKSVWTISVLLTLAVMSGIALRMLQAILLQGGDSAAHVAFQIVVSVAILPWTIPIHDNRSSHSQLPTTAPPGFTTYVTTARHRGLAESVHAHLILMNAPIVYPISGSIEPRIFGIWCMCRVVGTGLVWTLVRLSWSGGWGGGTGTIVVCMFVVPVVVAVQTMASTVLTNTGSVPADHELSPEELSRSDDAVSEQSSLLVDAEVSMSAAPETGLSMVEHDRSGTVHGHLDEVLPIYRRTLVPTRFEQTSAEVSDGCEGGGGSMDGHVGRTRAYTHEDIGTVVRKHHAMHSKSLPINFTFPTRCPDSPCVGVDQDLRWSPTPSDAGTCVEPIEMGSCDDPRRASLTVNPYRASSLQRSPHRQDFRRLVVVQTVTAWMIASSLVCNLAVLVVALPSPDPIVRPDMAVWHPRTRILWVCVLHPILRGCVRWVCIDVLALLLTRYSRADFFTNVLPIMGRYVEFVFAISLHVMVAASGSLRELVVLSTASFPLWILTAMVPAAWHTRRNLDGGTVSWKQFQVLVVNDLYIQILSSVLGWYLSTLHFKLVPDLYPFTVFLRLVVCLVANGIRTIIVFGSASILGVRIQVPEMRFGANGSFTFMCRVCIGCVVAISVLQPFR